MPPAEAIATRKIIKLAMPTIQPKNDALEHQMNTAVPKMTASTAHSTGVDACNPICRSVWENWLHSAAPAANAAMTEKALTAVKSFRITCPLARRRLPMLVAR
jgi:hypothetical protein